MRRPLPTIPTHLQGRTVHDCSYERARFRKTHNFFFVVRNFKTFIKMEFLILELISILPSPEAEEQAFDIRRRQGGSRNVARRGRRGGAERSTRPR